MHTSTTTIHTSPDTDRAVERLTEAHAVTVNGNIAMSGPLLEELRQARYPNLGRTKSGGGGGGDLLDMKAFNLYETTDADVRAWLNHYRQPQPDDLLEATRLLHNTLRAEAAGNRLDDPDRMFGMFHTWVQRIEDLFNPPREYELTEACPVCETEHVADKDGCQLWAVRVPVKEGRALVAECHHCGTLWAGHDQLTNLAESMQINVDWVALREFLGLPQNQPQTC
ncbi:hypothetical protein G7068_12110 [Leucobacter viscericola]|uniref:Uncharacterized protein n=1 Tax=Leucobacter viscericola TaxID=2714935 RepID=A0A6G7XH31_9MICO|nr:hypothetical protein [Leucobacter viscericola]QIK63853.1 hypothetical protein G7068_12110 [Leucobacter viscericola]